MKYVNYMTIIVICVLLPSCFQSSFNSQQNPLEFSLHKLQTEIEELKQDLNTHQMELNILEGKFLNQDNILASIREEMTEKEQHQFNDIKNRLGLCEKKILSYQQQKDKLFNELKELNLHAHSTTTALSQYKSRISELEVLINEKLKEFTSIRHELEVISEPLSLVASKKYRVQKGDTLKKIAKTMNISLEELKQVNHLQGDTIYVEQELIIPKINN
ncbi:MAG: LysM peptidoglycan-binding domain-containing protein [Chlamydiales bacterium]